MSEQAPQPNPQEVRPEEPDTYVTDPVKAEVMAYASKGQEERVVEHRAKALEAVSHLGEGDPTKWRSPDNNYGPADAAERAAQSAEQARLAADKHAQAASDVYDRVHKL